MTKPLLLAIDTAGPRLQLALTDGHHTDISAEDLPRGHAELIFGRIADLLARNDETHAGLTRIAVTSGPGSFTGLRIGLSAARGLGLARGIPVLGIPTLVAMSLSGMPDTSLAIVVDARRKEAYFQPFSAPGTPTGEAQLLPMETAQAEAARAEAVFAPMAADIGLMAQFALELDPAAWPPVPAYIRAADAKPQQKARIARLAENGR